jgi:hypothetical protein
MRSADQRGRREGVFTIVRGVVSGGIELAKLEITRGRQEVGENLAQVRGGVIMLAIAAGLGLVTLIALISVIMAALIVIGLWWVDLIILVVLVAAIALLAARGIGRLRSAQFVPNETIESVKEDVAWAKRLLRRG